MGQYWIPVNLDKHEYIHPHKLGSGLKLGEQIGTHPGTAAALVALLAAMPYRRGGGDIHEDEGVVGRWAGDRVVFIGDYAEDGDIPGFDDVPASLIYGLCREMTQEERLRHAHSMLDNGHEDSVGTYLSTPQWEDISDQVTGYLETELGGKYDGDGWRGFSYNDSYEGMDELTNTGDTLKVRVGNTSVFIKRTEDGVIANMYSSITRNSLGVLSTTFDEMEG